MVGQEERLLGGCLGRVKLSVQRHEIQWLVCGMKVVNTAGM